MKEKDMRGYATPEVQVIDLVCDAVLCASGETQKAWYQRGGVGDFTYDIEEDETWQ